MGRVRGCYEGRTVRLRGQCESANEEKQHGCQGLPGAGQTQSLHGEVSEGKGSKVSIKAKNGLQKVGGEESTLLERESSQGGFLLKRSSSKKNNKLEQEKIYIYLQYEISEIIQRTL